MKYANRNSRKLNSSLVDTFLRYHDDAENYKNQEVNYDELYDRLSKYAKPGENPEDMNVDELFVRATPAEQASMVRLISPSNWDDDFDDELNSACNKRRFNSNRRSVNSRRQLRANSSRCRRGLNCADNYGWVVENSEASEAYDLACEYYGADDINAAIVRCLSVDQLADCLAYLFRQYDFTEWQERKNGNE